jgi:glucose/arabinose dehydrogenase
MGCDPRPTPAIGVTQVGSGFSRPVFVTEAPGGGLYVVQQGGAIRTLAGGSFANHSGIVDNNATGSEEWGLLGLAFDPGFASNGTYYIYYTDGSSDLVDRVNGGSRTNLLSASNSTGHHYGGMLAIGPDGRLYASTGDADSGQSRSAGSDYGKVLAITLPGGATANKALGLRNPWRFSFDRSTGDMYIGDVGDTWEEIDIVPSGMTNVDFGWPDCDGAESCGGSEQPVEAFQDGKAVIGGYVYRGSAIPALQGAYVYTDYQNGWVRSLRWCGDGTVGDMHEYGFSVGDVSSMGEDAAGELYLVEHAAGRILKIVPM